MLINGCIKNPFIAVYLEKNIYLCIDKIYIS